MFPIATQYINHRCGLHLDEYQKKDPITGKLGIINSKGKFTACHDHKHITREKYEEVIPKIIDSERLQHFLLTVKLERSLFNQRSLIRTEFFREPVLIMP